jgi:hypothetical protein
MPQYAGPDSWSSKSKDFVRGHDDPIDDSDGGPRPTLRFTDAFCYAGGRTAPACSNLTARCPVVHAIHAGALLITFSWKTSMGR